jgi:hypothetical protein
MTLIGPARCAVLSLIVLVIAVGTGGFACAQSQAGTPGAAEGERVEVTYQIYSADKPPQKAREMAVKRAQAEAVRKVVGTKVQAERLSSSVQSGEERVERFAQVVRTGASGRVVESEVLEAETVERGGELFYRVRIRATVVPARGRADPAFDVSVSLNESDRVYVDRGAPEESQQLVASIAVSKDAYLTVFNVTPDTIRVVWPNSRLPEAFVPADTTVEFPPPDLRRLGLRWRVQVPEGEEDVTERIVVVATKKKIPFQPIPNYDVREGRLKTAAATLEALNRWLVKIPLDQRTLTTATYTVKRASGPSRR